jgi:hypothetical protein
MPIATVIGANLLRFLTRFVATSDGSNMYCGRIQNSLKAALRQVYESDRIAIVVWC